MQTPASRAINVGYLKRKGHRLKFVPCRLNLGAIREEHTYLATIDSLNLPQVQKILKKYHPEEISTITVLRETLSCRLASALYRCGIIKHFGDAFIGATHIKQDGRISTSYLYENIEGLHPRGLWIIADSICMGRNLAAALTSLLKKFKPKEILFICPIASKVGIENISKIIAQKNIPTTFVCWGALFGVNKTNLYDMPWGHPDTQSLDLKDQQTFVNMYGKDLCVGGDFGNDYFCPPLAKKLYKEQLNKYHITPHIPTAKQILKIYKLEEILTWYPRRESNPQSYR